MRKAGAVWGAAAMLLAAACQRPLDNAEALINAGKLPEAERVLVKASSDHPRDVELRLALGRVYLLETRVTDADNVLLTIANDPKYRPRIASEYREAALRAASQRGAYYELSQVAPTAARLDPLLHDSICQLLIDHFDPALGLDPVAKAAAGIDPACRKKTGAALIAMVKKTPAASADPATLERICEAADEEASLDCARAMRDIAQKIGSSDRLRAARVLEGASHINKDVANDLTTAVLRSSIGDRAAASSEVGAQLELTKRMVRELGSALNLYSSQHGGNPTNVKSIGQLAAMLAGYLSNEVPEQDAWGGEFEYVATAERARIISGGADKHIDPESRKIGGAKRGAIDEYGADIIWEDRGLIQEPLERALHKYDAAPATKH
jgi:hypothetical protein